MTGSVHAAQSWTASFASCLTPRRLRAQAIILGLCLWGVCIADFSTPGIFDRAGNIKFQDFLQFPIAARLISQGRAAELYQPQILDQHIAAVVGHPTRVHLEYYYGPQVALPFIPLERLSVFAQAALWVAISLLLYGGCIYLLWKSSPTLKPYAGLVALTAVAYPPLFHFLVRGQISAVALVCFTAAYFAFRSKRNWLAGIILGFLFFKPPFLAAIPLVLLFAQAWQSLAGLMLSAAMQFAFAFAYFGGPVMRSYLHMLVHSAGAPGTTELSYSAIQMHSLQAFWSLLIPWPLLVRVCYLVSAFTAIFLAAAIWRSASPLLLRFSALLVAAALVDPHLYIYDLLALAPALLLLIGWSVQNRDHPRAPSLQGSIYFAFILPLFGPLARWTHLQLSVIAFAALLWTLYLITRSYKLALTEPSVV